MNFKPFRFSFAGLRLLDPTRLTMLICLVFLSSFILISSWARSENNSICLPLEVTSRGETINAGTSALRYSNVNWGTIAVSAFPGADIHNSAEQLVNYFASVDSVSVCFVNDSYWPNRGSVISFYVAGLPIEYDGRSGFGLKELRSNPAILKKARDEALMAEVAKASQAAN